MTPPPPQPQVAPQQQPAAAASSEHPHLHDLARKLAAGEVQLLDVREPHEVARGKCNASVNFPLSEMRAESPKPPEGLDKSKTIYLHCGRGVRVHPAKELLSGMGFDADRLRPLAEGYDALAIFARTNGYSSLRSNLDPVTPASPMLFAAVTLTATAEAAEKARTWLPLTMQPVKRQVSASSESSSTASVATFGPGGSSDRLFDAAADTDEEVEELRIRGFLQHASDTRNCRAKKGRRMSSTFGGILGRILPSAFSLDGDGEASARRSRVRATSATSAASDAADFVDLSSVQSDSDVHKETEGNTSDNTDTERERPDLNEEETPAGILRATASRLSADSIADASPSRASSMANLVKTVTGVKTLVGSLRSSQHEYAVSGRRETKKKKKKRQRKTVADALCDLYAMRSVPLDDFLDGKLPLFPFAVSSISERAFIKYVAPTAAVTAAGTAAGHAADVQHFWQHQTQRQLGRLYPSMWRVASDNYDPLAIWRMGVQMAALNYQVNDLPLQLNRAFFRRGGGTGFVRKPAEMRICPDDCTGVLGDATCEEESRPADDGTAPVVAVGSRWQQALRGSSSSQRESQKGTSAAAAAGRGRPSSMGAAPWVNRWRMSSAGGARSSTAGKGHNHTHKHSQGGSGRHSCSSGRQSGGMSTRRTKLSSLTTRNAVPVASPHWPPAREELRLLEIQLLGLYHLPTTGEARPSLEERLHQHVRELSGAHLPPTCGSPAAPSVCLTVHEIGGFVAIAPSIEELKRSGDTSFQDAKRLKVPSSGVGGLCAAFGGASAFCLVAEPWECLLRVGVQDGESEVAYEAMVMGALRPGYRCVPLRVPATGCLIQGCVLLVRISIDSAPSAWIDDHDTLRRKILKQQEDLDEQAKTIAQQAKELAKLRGMVSQGGSFRRSISRQKTATVKRVLAVGSVGSDGAPAVPEEDEWRTVGAEDAEDADREDSDPRSSDSATSGPDDD